MGTDAHRRHLGVEMDHAPSAASEQDTPAVDTTAVDTLTGLLDRLGGLDASNGSLASVYSRRSIASIGSILSIGSSGSILSIGSTGSILSIGSAGSILSIGSAGSILSIGSAGSITAVGGSGSLGRLGAWLEERAEAASSEPSPPSTANSTQAERHLRAI